MRFLKLFFSCAIILNCVCSAKAQQCNDPLSEYREHFKNENEEERVPLGVLVISDYGKKPLLSAAKIFKIIDSGDTEELEFAMDLKNANVKSKDGETPLLYAARKANKPAIIDVLVAAGAEIEKKDKNGYTPLMLAVERPVYSSIAVALIKNKANVNAIHKKGNNSVLMLALVNGTVSPNIIQALVDTGADVHFKNSDKNTPLLLALKNSNNASIANILAKAGADIEQKDADGLSPMMIAVSRPSYPNLTIALINNKADINAVYDNSMTMFMMALSNSATKPEVIKAFIDNGVDVDAKNFDGTTPLMFAAMNFDEETIKMFKKAKADFSIQDNNGRTAQDYAKDNLKISQKFLKKMK